MKKEENVSKKVMIIMLLIIITLLIIALFLIILTKPKYSIKIKPNSSFTIIVLPDTQKYSEKYPEIFINQTNWIKENKAILNIRFVIHEGDIVNNPKDKKQWDVSNKSLSILDEDIPYSILPGNHDSNEKTDYSYYNLYFPETRYENKQWYGGSFDHYKNNYQIMNIDGKDYVFISLQFCPNSSEINWADSVLDKYQNHTAILTTHAYLDSETKRTLCNSTEYIWDMVKNYENLQLILSGHIHAERKRVDLNLKSKPVYQLSANYQDLGEGGDGYLRILEFNQDKTILVQTYSPYKNKYKTGDESEFMIKL